MTQREPGPQQWTGQQWTGQQWQAQEWQAQEWQVQGGHPGGRAVPVPGAAQSGPQPQWVTGPGTTVGWRPGPVSAAPSERTRAVLPTPVITAAVVSLAVGGLLLVQVLATLFDAQLGLAAIARLVIPTLLVVGGVTALRGRRGWLTTGAVFLLLTGGVLAVALVSSDRYDSPTAVIEAALRVLVGALVIVSSRLPVATTFFETAEELRYGRAEADFFR